MCLPACLFSRFPNFLQKKKQNKTKKKTTGLHIVKKNNQSVNKTDFNLKSG